MAKAQRTFGRTVCRPLLGYTRPSRRDFLSLFVALAGTSSAMAQQRSFRVGMLSLGQVSADAFRQWGLPELASLGFADGRNLVFFDRSTEGDATRLQELALEVLAERPDVVIAVSNPAAHAIRRADPSMRIVMGFAGTDPVSDGLVQSLARPGGPVTGVVMLAEELDMKRIEVARELMPRARIGFLAGTTFPDGRIARTLAAAQAMGIELLVERATGPETHGPALERLHRAGARAVVVASFPSFAGNAAALGRWGRELGLPIVCEWAFMVEAGCLASYGPNNEALRRRTAQIVARVLRGENPGVVPMEQPSRFEFALNARIAREIGLDIPHSVLARADEVFEQ